MLVWSSVAGEEDQDAFGFTAVITNLSSLVRQANLLKSSIPVIVYRKPGPRLPLSLRG